MLKLLDLLNEESLSAQRDPQAYPGNEDYSKNFKYITGGNSEILCSLMGLIETTLLCTSCRRQSFTFEPYTILSLGLVTDKSRTVPMRIGTDASKPRAAPHQLEDLMRQQVSMEDLEEDEWINCEKCGEKGCKHRQNKLVSVPDTLVIHFKRFIAREVNGSYQLVKNSQAVMYPEEFDLGPYVSEPNIKTLAQNQVGTEQTFEEGELELSKEVQKVRRSIPYQLKAVINHRGSLHSGHYYTAIREDEKWLEFNDERVSELDEAGWCTMFAYILVYERQKESLLSQDGR